MPRIAALLCCLLLVLTQSVHAHRFVAALDFPGTALARCAVNEHDSRVGTASVKLEIDTVDTRLHSVQRFGCAPDGWQLRKSDLVDQPLQLNNVEDGFDQIRVLIPRSALPDAPLLRAWFISLDDTGNVADQTDPPADAMLSSAGNPLGVPLMGDLNRLLLIGLILATVVAAMRMRRFGHVPAMLFLTLGLGVGLGGRTVAESSFVAPTLAWQDPGYDTMVAQSALDLRHAKMHFSGRDLELVVAVNNLEPALLKQQDRMLFIGNSLTSSNNLPGLLSRLAAQAGKQLDARAQTIGGSSLEDHFRAGNATREIAAGRYPVVVLQQGPSSLPENQIYLRTWTERFNSPIRAAGGRPLLYMVWPDRSRLAFFSDVRDSYRDAALAVDGAFAPAGETWLRAWALDPELAFYSNDDFHPTLLGSYVAALSLFCTVYQQSPEGLPAYIEQANGARTPLPPATASLLQRAAWDTYREEGLRGLP